MCVGVGEWVVGCMFLQGTCNSKTNQSIKLKYEYSFSV